MLDNERTVLKENGEELADLLTENVPYLLSHYLSKDVLTESEREAIISAGASQEIKMKLLETISDKEGISMEEVIEGLNATENHSVSKRINSLLSDKKPSDEDANKDGSGDKVEDVSVVATSLVDEVIAKAEDQTNSSFEEEPKEESEKLNETIETVSTESSPGSDSKNAEPAEETHEVDSVQMEEKLVEASVEVHKTEEAEEEVSSPEQEQMQVEASDVPDRTVTFHENVSVNYVAASFMESDSDHEEQEEEKVDELQNTSVTDEPANGYQSHGVDIPNESENEDVDNIDIEKEFVMPAEAESNNNVNVLEQSKLANGGRNMTRMDSNDIILDGEDKAAVNGNESPSTGDEGLDSILARKALVRQQVQKFEKSSPGQGAVKYSIRSSASIQEKPAVEAQSESGSNVKNLKNFFQKLSTSSDSTTPPSGGAAKPVGKLKVTFPAS